MVRRGQVRYERISNSSARASCFAKRRRTLFKMAYELNTLVGASVLVLVQHNSIKEFYCTEDMEEKLKQVEDRGRRAQVQVKTDTPYTANPDDMAIAAQPSDIEIYPEAEILGQQSVMGSYPEADPQHSANSNISSTAAQPSVTSMGNYYNYNCVMAGQMLVGSFPQPQPDSPYPVFQSIGAMPGQQSASPQMNYVAPSMLPVHGHEAEISDCISLPNQ